ncbi:MAG: ATP-binding protein [Sulfurifustis sp.]
MLKRFHRRLGTGQRGTALGLSIVQEIAEPHRAERPLESAERDRGLRVVDRFNPVAASAKRQPKRKPTVRSG